VSAQDSSVLGGQFATCHFDMTLLVQMEQKARHLLCRQKKTRHFLAGKGKLSF